MDLQDYSLVVIMHVIWKKKNNQQTNKGEVGWEEGEEHVCTIPN